ncbi:MAG: hypothetical protein ACXWUN_03680 [Allosphingosinicella sp.]
MTRSLSLSLAAALALLTACGQEEGRGGLSAEEERQLDNAAQMLDENMIDASPDSMVADEAELDAIEDVGDNVADDATAANAADANAQ